MLNKHAASTEQSARLPLLPLRDHMERARIGLESAHREGLNAAEVLRNPHVQASHLRVAREEINKAIAIIEQTRW